MLKKKTRVLFLGLLVLVGSACVTPTHASSAQAIVINYIQATGAGGAKEEVIALHNNTNEEIDITNWCLINRSAVAFACFSARSVQYPHTAIRYVIPEFGDAVIASAEYKTQTGLGDEYFSLVYAATDQSSGSLVSASDTLSLMDDEGNVIDAKAWTSAVTSGKALARRILTTNPVVYAANGDASDWLVPVARQVPAQGSLYKYFEDIDDQAPDPSDPVDPVDPEQIPTIPAPFDFSNEPYITEVFANPAGADTGFEFFELYNPSATNPVDMSRFKVQVGLNSLKQYSFPAGSNIGPQQYAAFYTHDLGFTLLNTSSAVQLIYEGLPMGGRVEYVSPKDDMSWALIDKAWQYIRFGSPGEQNLLAAAVESDLEQAQGEAAKKPCASNQYRNLETGRCKLTAPLSTAQSPCKVGQERNEQTGRCRNLVSAQASVTPCKAGQERNAETNRCRTIAKMSEAGNGVRGVQTQRGNQPSWYYLVAIALIIIAVLAYGIWEWRVELSHIWSRMRQRFAK